MISNMVATNRAKNPMIKLGAGVRQSDSNVAPGNGVIRPAGHVSQELADV